MNEHESIRNLLPLASAGALEIEEQRRVAQHVQSCEDCQRDFETWNLYAQAFRHLPQPSVPAGLLERTHTRILQQNGRATSDRVHAILLAAIAIFGWVVSLTLWVIGRSLTGGVVNIAGVNLASLLSWLLLSAVLTSVIAAASAAVFVRCRDMRINL